MKFVSNWTAFGFQSSHPTLNPRWHKTDIKIKWSNTWKCIGKFWQACKSFKWPHALCLANHCIFFPSSGKDDGDKINKDMNKWITYFLCYCYVHVCTFMLCSFCYVHIWRKRMTGYLSHTELIILVEYSTWVSSVALNETFWSVNYLVTWLDVSVVTYFQDVFNVKFTFGGF